MHKTITIFLATVLLFAGCIRDSRMNSTFSQMGYKPIYGVSGSLADNIKTTAAQPLTETGKIYVKGNLLLVNKPYTGIHIIDNTDPKAPVNKYFLNIPGNIDVSMKGNYLYADYSGRIVVIDISNPEAPKVTQAVELEERYQQYPPQADIQNNWINRTYFECPDPSKGKVIGWIYTRIQNAKCWREQ